MTIEKNKIREIYKGHYQVILDFPAPHDLKKIINTSYRYIWGYGHQEAQTNWTEYNYQLFEKKIDNGCIMARNLDMEYLIETSYFLELIPYIHQTIKIIQTNIIPPYYLNIKNLSGKSKYDLLKNKIDYLFELEMPGAIDYAPLISSDVNFLEQVIKKFS